MLILPRRSGIEEIYLEFATFPRYLSGVWACVTSGPPARLRLIMTGVLLLRGRGEAR
jgi:hypothetical protein